jgi:uncharacterized protein YajQ (UPF0234 family)
MTVYVLTSTYVCVDSGDYESCVVGVYENVENALEQMKQEIKDTRTDFENYDTEEETYVEGDMSWSIWESEEYMSHHCDIQITECIVKKGETK